jgi:hypothetical protein
MSSAIAAVNSLRAIDADDPILSDEKLWQVVSSGDLKGLTPAQKTAYFLHRCKVEGLNPASQPFVYITFQGKEILYATRSAADQLRRLHNISIVSVNCVEDDEYISYEVRVRDPQGREDFEVGSVFVGTVKGVERSNAKMKAITKAKRRATYSICGTGALDETELGDLTPMEEQPESIATNPQWTPRPPRIDPVEAEVRGIAVDAFASGEDDDTGEILDADEPEQTSYVNGTDMMSPDQRGQILFLAGKLDWKNDRDQVDMPRINQFCGNVTGISNLDNLSAQRAAMVIDELREHLRSQRKGRA